MRMLLYNLKILLIKEVRGQKSEARSQTEWLRFVDLLNR